MLCETLKMLHLCFSPCTGALGGAECLELQHPASAPAAADHDVGKTEGVSRCPGQDHGEGAAAAEKGTPGGLRGNQKRIWLTLEQKAPKFIEMGDVHGKMSSLSPESTESMVMFLLWQLPGGNGVHLSDPAPPSSAGLYLESEPVSSTSNSFQPREFSTCVSCEENTSCIDQVFESYLQTETHLDPLLNSTQSTSPYFPDSFQAAPFCFNQSLTPGSSSDSSTLSGSLDYSYSLAQLPACAPENYNSPPSLDPRNCGNPSEEYSYSHLPSYTQYDCFPSAGPSVCYCTSCEAEHVDTLRAAECFSYPSTDYVNLAPSAAVASEFYKRGTNWDICYS
ncbi:POU class 2 homeobox associating factor 3 isoform X2 [Lutra lutra]|uniref:POU class 2 homeobox associating factor 3 isoform X2 n=1 Tax=Lutra lutra TaxID=9657 RepID=UPI001FD06178|nr:POU class 2 homeobox associating factor 3 isoform X2 [Lutra lutra]